MSAPITDIASRLEKVRVDVRTDLEITRQILSGQPVYVIRDPIHSQSFQLSAADYQLLIRIHSRSTLGEIFQELCQCELLSTDDCDRFYQMILQMHQLGILALPIADGKSLYRRHQQRLASQRRWSIQKILFRRIPIWQPDRFLDHTSGYVRFLFGRAFFVCWMVGVLVLAVLLGLRWEEFRQPVGSMLALENLAWVWCLLVVLKAIHELGHAYACKIFGGHVPEIGIFLILFTPCAYVDASSSWGFPKRRHRLIVGLAGMYFESLCAMVACLIWLVTAPGLVHSLAVYAITLSTAITIGFNANPLMRYDGYFILSDLLNVANLRSVARDYFWGWCKHLAYGLQRPITHFGPLMRWFLGAFGLGTFIYGTFVVLTICYVLAFQLRGVGPWLAGILLVSLCWKFLSSQFHYLTKSPELDGHRTRAAIVVSLVVIGAIWIVTACPIQQEIILPGTVEWDRVVELRSPTDGYVKSTMMRRGNRLEQGDILLSLENPQLDEELWAAESTYRAILIQLQQEIEQESAAVGVTRAELELSRERLDRARRKSLNAQVDAPVTGQLIDEAANPLLGDYVQEGESLGRIGTGDWVVRVHLDDQHQSQCAPSIGDRIRFRIARSPHRDYWGEVERVVIRSDRAEHLASSLAVSPSSTADDSNRASLEYELTLHCDSTGIKELVHGDSAIVKLKSRQMTLGQLLWLRGRQLWHDLLLQGA